MNGKQESRIHTRVMRVKRQRSKYYRQKMRGVRWVSGGNEISWWTAPLDPMPPHYGANPTWPRGWVSVGFATDEVPPAFADYIQRKYDKNRPPVNLSTSLPLEGPIIDSDTVGMIEYLKKVFEDAKKGLRGEL